VREYRNPLTWVKNHVILVLDIWSFKKLWTGVLGGHTTEGRFTARCCRSFRALLIAGSAPSLLTLGLLAINSQAEP